MDNSDRGQPVHPIGLVAKRTGLNIHVLRAWERRYGVVEPRRTAGGSRRYSEEDVQRLSLLRRLVEGGHAIGDVARLPLAELQALARASLPGGAAAAEGEGSAAVRVGQRYVDECLARLTALDAPAVQAVLMRAVLALRSSEFVAGVAVPLLRRVGELWESGELRPSHEHTVSVAMDRALGWLLGSVEAQPGAPVLLASTPSGDIHGFGAMLAGVVAAEEGWTVAYLGPNLPAEDLAAAAVTTGASVLALSVVVPPDSARLQELVRLADAVRGGARVVVGGAGALAAERRLTRAGLEVLHDFDELRAVLREMAAAERMASPSGVAAAEESR